MLNFVVRLLKHRCLTVRNLRLLMKNDETDLKKRIEKLEEELHNLKQERQIHTHIFEALKDPIALLDSNYRYIFTNHAYRKFHNLTTEELSHCKLSDVTGKKIFDDVIKEKFDRCLKGETISFEHDSGRNEREKTILKTHFYPYQSNDNKITGVIISAKVITEQKKIENEIIRQNTEYEALNEEFYVTNDELRQNYAELEKLNIEINQQKQTLAISEQKYRILFEGSRDGIVFISPEGKLIECNESFLKMTGYSSSELRTMDFYKITPKRWHEWKIDEVIEKQLKARGFSDTYEKEYIRKDGTTIPVEVTAYRITTKDNRLLYWIVAKDISERRKHRRELDHSRDMMQKILKASSVGLSYAVNRKIIWANEAMEELFGYSKDEYRHKDTRMLYPSDDEYRRVGKIVFDKIKNKEVVKLNATFIRKDGSLFYGRYKINYIEPENPEKGVIASIIDITDLIKSQRDLEASEQRYRFVANNTQDFIYMTDPDGKMLFVSSNTQRFFGIAPEEMKSLYLSELMQRFAIPEKTRQYILKTTSNAILNKKEMAEYVYQISVDGKEKWFETNEKLLYDKNLNFAGIIGVTRDITERKQFEKQLIEAKDKAEESDRLKTAFLNNISHEFRTPMNGILGFADLLTNTAISNGERKEYVSLIRQSCNELLRILQDIIEISQVQNNMTKIHNDEINLYGLITEAIQIAKPKIEDRHIALKTNMRFHEKELFVISDYQKLSRIIKHLIDNAAKFTINGYIEIDCSISDRSEFRFSVSDTGIGISPKMQKLIFKPFRQAETGSSRKFGGSGIGLALAKAYIELLGGKIWLDSEINRGTTIYFSIPVEVIPPPVKVIEFTNPRIDWKNINVLIVEDEEVNYLYLEKIIMEKKAGTIRAHNGKEAVDICRNNADIDVILMDLQMPVMDGYEATKLIKQFRSDIPVIAQTAYAQNDDRQKMVRSGFNNYVVKPVTKNRLIHIIEQSLRSEI